MLADGTLLLVLTVIFIATVIRSAFGFGEALIAVPLLAFVIPVEVAAPLAVLVSITVAVAILVEDWRHIQFRAASGLVAASLAGIPVGLWLLSSAPTAVIKASLGAIIIAFSTYALLSRTPFVLKDDKLAWMFGFLAGVLGGAYGMNGPPLVVYGALRRWPPGYFRATLQGYFLPASAVGMMGYWLTGLWTPAVTQYYLLSLPVAAAAFVIGRWLSRRLKSQRFLVCVHIGLLIVGAMLLLQPLWRQIGAAVGS